MAERRNSNAGKLPVNSLKADPRLQARVTTCQDTVDKYAEWLKEHPDEDLPAIEAFEDTSGNLFVWDGQGHRLPAYHLAGRERIPVRVKKGDFRDAWRASLGANADHGLPRQSEDIRKAVNAALDDAETGEWTLEQLAALCRVHRGTVARVKKEREGLVPVASRKGRPGVNQHTKAKQEPAPEPAKIEPELDAPAWAAGPYRCPDCEESFIRQLWHCPGCGTHWPPNVHRCDQCGGTCPYSERELLQAEADVKAQLSAPTAPAKQPMLAAHADEKLSDEGAEQLVAMAADDTLPTHAGADLPAAEATYDQQGRVCPPEVVDAFNVVSRFRSVIQHVGHLKTELADLAAGVGGEWLQTTWKTVKADLENAASQVKFATPYVVCPVCDGKRTCDKESGVCRSLGWLTQNQFQHLTAEQREKCKAA